MQNKHGSTPDIWMFDTWVFDFDGTIIDIQFRLEAIYKHLVKEMKGVALNNYWESRRSGLSEVDLVRKSGVDIKHMKKYDNLRSSFWDSPEYTKLDVLHTCVAELLTLLHKKRKRMILLTHREKQNTLLHQLENLKVKQYFSEIICTKKKLAENEISSTVDQFYAIEEKSKYLLLNKERFQKTVMLGDSPSDVQAAITAGVHSIAISAGLFNKYELLRWKPTFLFDSIEDLYKELQR